MHSTTVSPKAVIDIARGGDRDLDQRSARRSVSLATDGATTMDVSSNNAERVVYPNEALIAPKQPMRELWEHRSLELIGANRVNLVQALVQAALLFRR